MIRSLFMAALCCVLQGSCISMKPVKFLRADSISADVIDNVPQVRLRLVFRNPNAFGCTVTRLHAEGQLKGKPFFEAAVDSKLKAGAKSDFTVPITSRLAKQELSQLLNTGIDAYLWNEAIEVRLNGTLKVRKFIFTKTMRFEYKQQIDKTQLNKLF